MILMISTYEYSIFYEFYLNLYELNAYFMDKKLLLPTRAMQMLFVIIMLNKNTLGVKKVQGQSEAALQIAMCNQKL